MKANPIQNWLALHFIQKLIGWVGVLLIISACTKPAGLKPPDVIRLTASTYQEDEQPDQSAALLPAAQTRLGSLADFPRYNLTLTILDNTYQGQAHITYTNTETTALNQLYFRLLPNGHNSFGDGSMTIANLTVDGQPASSTLSVSNSALEVSLERPLEPRQKTEVAMDFSGVVPVNFGSTAQTAGYGIYNVSNKIMTLSGWYPILAVHEPSGWRLDPVSWMGDSTYSTTAFFTVNISAPVESKIVTTGIEVIAVDHEISETRNLPPDQQPEQRSYISGPARDFIVIVGQELQESHQSVDGTTIHSYYFPKHQSAGKRALEIAVESLQIYNQQIGAYPYRELDVVETALKHASGVEFPGVILISSDLYDTPDQPAFVVTVAHEVAHQWWYNVVGNDVFLHPWQDEALTTYTSSLYYEFGLGKSAAQGLIQYWQDRYDQLSDQGIDDRIAETLAHYQNRGDPSLYSTIVYSKGALFFINLRQQIGDTAFFQAMRSYYQTYQYQIATPDNLLNAFEQSSGRSLRDLYQQWLYSASRP